MSTSITITKKEILAEFDRIHPIDYLKIFAYLKHIQKSEHVEKKSSQALKKLFSLEGCLSDIKMTSLELQKKVADIWKEKYEIN